MRLGARRKAAADGLWKTRCCTSAPDDGAMCAILRRAPRRRDFPRQQRVKAPSPSTPGRLPIAEMKLELVPVPVSDVDRAKAFYVEEVGFNPDHEHMVREGR